MLMKIQFTVKEDSKIFKTIYILYLGVIRKKYFTGRSSVFVLRQYLMVLVLLTFSVNLFLSSQSFTSSKADLCAKAI